MIYMRAKTVNEVLQEPFTNNTRNGRISGTFPLSRIQYEDSDKHPKRKYKKGDKVRYKTYLPASGMVATSTVEKGEDMVGRISKYKKGFMGRIDYVINGMEVPESYIIEKIS